MGSIGLGTSPCAAGTAMRRRASCLAASSSALHPQTIHISSTQNPAVKHCVKLRESGRYRREAGAALLAGADLVLELAPYCAPYRALVALDGDQLPQGVPSQRYVTVTPPVMQKIAGLDTVGGGLLAAEAALPPPAGLLGAPRGSLTRLLVLDGVQDPGNLGTLLRTALALGWQAAALLPGCCDPFNGKAVRASRGAVFKLPLAQLSLEQWGQVLEEQGMLALAAEPDRSAAAQPAAPQQQQQQQAQQQAQAQAGAGSVAGLQQHLDERPVCLCLGAEGQGLSEGVRRRCRALSVPQPGGAELMESLNVSAAGAILMFALSRGAAPLLAELAEL